MKNLSFIGYDQYAACRTGRIFSLRSGKYLAGVDSPNGYRLVSLSQGGVKKQFLVHRIIAQAFLPNPDNKRTVNHLDGDKKNNKLENLAWATDSEQAIHAIESGLRKKFINDYRTYSDELIHRLCQMIVENFRTKEIVDLLDVPGHLVANVRKKTQYTDISCEYDFSKILPCQKRISVSKIISVCELLQQGATPDEIKDKTGVSYATISRVRTRKDYTYLSMNYKF